MINRFNHKYLPFHLILHMLHISFEASLFLPVGLFPESVAISPSLSLFPLSSLRSTTDWTTTTNGGTLSSGWYCRTASVPLVWFQSSAKCP